MQAPEVQVVRQVALTGFQPNEVVAHEAMLLPEKKEPTGTWWHVP